MANHINQQPATTGSNSFKIIDNNDGSSRSGGVLGSVDYDDEEGEPPNIPRPTTTTTTRTECRTEISTAPSIMTAASLHTSQDTVRRMSQKHPPNATVTVKSRGKNRVPGLATILLICMLQCIEFCVAEEGGVKKDISWIHEEAAKGAPNINVLAEGATSPGGIRGRANMNIQSSKNEGIVLFGTGDEGDDDKCSYECCSSFIDIMGHDLQHNKQISQSEITGRMLQDNNTTNTTTEALQESTTSAIPEPCPTTQDEENSGGVGLPKAVQYILIIILVMFSALFSGLTLGLMSLDPSGLEIVMANSDDPRLARAAKAIYPVRLNGNLLLCTLLLGNVGVNSMLSILMADLAGGLVAFIVSTAVIVVFGEIIPQALCSRFALQVGEKTVPLVKLIIVLLYPICKPLSWVLNKVLGHEIGTTYSTSEMAKLIEIHVQRGQLEGATGAAMTGALRYRSVSVSEVMTPLVNTFMLSADDRLGFDTVAKIFKTGYSRIPVYEVSKSNIIGLLFVKDLIFLDPEDEIPVKNFVQIFGRGLHVVWPDDKLDDVLKLLKSGRSHIALVRDVNDGKGEVDPYYEIKGIITLEDIIEIILGDEIVDETDQLVDVNDPYSSVRRSDMGDYIEGAIEKSGRYSSDEIEKGGDRCDWEARLRLLDERLVDEHLSPDEVRAVAAHLKTNYSKAVELISDRQLKEVLSLVPVSEILPAESCTAVDGGDECSGMPTVSAELIYERGVPADFCTVVLSGKIMIMSGADKFRSDVSNWGVLASRALTDPSYVPDFSAWVLPNQNNTGGCRCVKLDRKSYCGAVDNTALEKTTHDVDHAQPVAASAIIMRESPVAMNGHADKDSKSTMALAPTTTVPDHPPHKDETQLQPATSPSPQTPEDADVPTRQSYYVRLPNQRQTHSRRSKLLKAFTRATSKKDTKTPE